jgi:hypothetical protein
MYNHIIHCIIYVRGEWGLECVFEGVLIVVETVAIWK